MVVRLLAEILRQAQHSETPSFGQRKGGG